MGITDVFGDRADLSGIAPGQRLAVSEVKTQRDSHTDSSLYSIHLSYHCPFIAPQVVHQATLDVDEVGATAAAATGVGITLMSFQHVPVLKFNRAFMFGIIERGTENMLFMGKIVNPNK